MNDVILVLRLMPIATQPSAVSVFLSIAKCGLICRSPSDMEPSTLADGFLQGSKNEFEKLFGMRMAGLCQFY